MKFRIVSIIILSPFALAAPVTRDTLATAQASVDQLLSHMKKDREVAEKAIRTLQTKVLGYGQSVEGYKAWNSYLSAHESAVSCSGRREEVSYEVDGLHGIRQENMFGFQSML